MGKGSSPRPFQVSDQEYANRWDAIFGKDDEKKNDPKAMGSTESDRTRNSGSLNNSQGQTGQTEDA